VSSFWYDLPREFEGLSIDKAVRDGKECFVCNPVFKAGVDTYPLEGVGLYPVDAVLSASQKYSEKMVKGE
jgi:hypothetical protein